MSFLRVGIQQCTQIFHTAVASPQQHTKVSFTVLLPQKTSLQVLNAAVCTKMLILISPLPNVCISCVEVEQKKTNIALSIPLMPWNKAIFGLDGLEFCQKMRICMLNLAVLITHFHKNLKHLHLKCVSWKAIKWGETYIKRKPYEYRIQWVFFNALTLNLR